jgi:predicted membrane metal-binding protein
MNDSSPAHSIADQVGHCAEPPLQSELDQAASEDQPRTLTSFGRFPAATIALSLATGVLCDRYGNWSPNVLVGCFATAALLWIALQLVRRVREAAIAVVVISAFVGANYHHHVWHRLPAEDITPLLSQEPVLIRCEGVVASAPVVSPPRENPFSSGLPPKSSTQFQLDVESLNAATGQRRVSGRLRFVVDGILEGVNTGDRVDVQGWSQANRPLMNPGGFDVAAYSRSRSLRGISFGSESLSWSRSLLPVRRSLKDFDERFATVRKRYWNLQSLMK